MNQTKEQFEKELLDMSFEELQDKVRQLSKELIRAKHSFVVNNGLVQELQNKLLLVQNRLTALRLR